MPFGIICINSEEYRNLENKTIKDCQPKEQLLRYEIFENEKFYFKNDTIIHLNSQNDSCQGIKIRFSNKEKTS